MIEKTCEREIFQAAFHDIGKIVNWDALGLREVTDDGKLEGDPHEFQKCVDTHWQSPSWGIDPSAPIWQYILLWHPKWGEQYPNSMSRWYTRPSDWLASSYSRPLLQEQRERLKSSPTYGVYKLWSGTRSEDRRLSKKEELKDLISFINQNPSWDEARSRYEHILRARPEEARPGFDVTSLLSHCTIVGRLAAVLSKCHWEGVDPKAGVTRKALRNLKNPPQLFVSHFRVSLRQRPFRARDVGIFARMEEKFILITEEFSANLLTRVGLECVTVFNSEEARRLFVRKLEQNGFVVQERCISGRLNDYILPTSDSESAPPKPIIDVVNQRWQTVYIDKPAQRIDAPICEGCQMSPAVRHWPKDYLAERAGWHPDTVRLLNSTPWREISLEAIPEPDRSKLSSWFDEWGEEDLCDQCFLSRCQTQPINLLKTWKGDVLYIRIYLDIEKLAGHDRTGECKQPKGCLLYLQKRYILETYPDIAEVDPNCLDDLIICFPLIADFVDEYKRYLESVWSLLADRFEDRFACLATDLACMGIENRTETFDILNTLHDSFSETFRKLIDLPDDVHKPISFRLSLSNNKHPFFDHWRFLEEAQSEVCLQIVGSGRAQFRMVNYPLIREAIASSSRAQLHKLAAAAAISPSLGELVLRERSSRRSTILNGLAKLIPDRLDLESARVLANLMEG